MGAVRRAFEQSLAERGIQIPLLKELAPSVAWIRRDSRERKNFSSVVNFQDPASGRTALHIAAAEGLVDVCQRILSREDFSAVNAEDKQGKTALAYAEAAGHTEICQMIRRAGRVEKLQLQ